ncbi:helix-turn-helix transcriptional regulator [Roseomonas sp. 18066]|uniref:AraC family transcriptional regulator n=1 Tax=Roseomonas sp. 18066 TaxID=2681412 RepID=UPI001356BBEE|nr:helix-turn-helix transcriptional regulator [Roseomonas sp. 18066]
MLKEKLRRAIEGQALLAAAAGGHGPARVTPTHHHAKGQLLGCGRGLITVGTGAGSWCVPAAHAVWLPPHHPHSVQSHGDYQGWSLYVAEPACAELPAMPRIIRVSPLLQAAALRAAEWEAAPPEGARAHLAAVILDEIAHAPAAPFGLPMPQDARLLRIAQALAADPAARQRMEDWAAWAGIAPRSLSRRFVQETGFSFTEWGQRLRLMRALELLAEGASVTSVALDLGYSNVSFFIALFRRSFGRTPHAYGQLPPEDEPG